MPQDDLTRLVALTSQIEELELQLVRVSLPLNAQIRELRRQVETIHAGWYRELTSIATLPSDVHTWLT